MNKKVVIIGASAAALGTAYKTRLLDPHAEILCISKEKEAYNTCLLAEYLAHARSRESLATLTPERARKNNISSMLDTSVIAIDRHHKAITTQTHAIIPYDFLCIATGSVPRRFLPENHTAIHGLFNFHFFADTERINAYITEQMSSNAIIIGGGLTGLEVADALHKQGIRCTLIERSRQILSHHVDETESNFIISHIQNTYAISVLTSQSVLSVNHTDGKVTGVTLSNGSIIVASLIISTIGAVPNTSIAKQAGLALHTDFIQVDRFMQTNDPAIVAAGDCCLVTPHHFPSYTWQHAMYQGTIAAHTICAQPKAYSAPISYRESAFFGISLAIGGITKITPIYTQEILHQETYRHRFIYQPDKTLVGFILIGNTAKAADLKRTIETQQENN